MLNQNDIKPALCMHYFLTGGNTDLAARAKLVVCYERKWPATMCTLYRRHLRKFFPLCLAKWFCVCCMPCLGTHLCFGFLCYILILVFFSVCSISLILFFCPVLATVRRILYSFGIACKRLAYCKKFMSTYPVKP